MKRENTKAIKVGNVVIGGSNKVVIQSMTNTPTKDIEATVKQILELEKAGCEIIRCAVLDMEDAIALKKIKEQIHIPLVSDIHFDYRLALQAIESGVDKIRINPGNISNPEHVKLLVEKCKEKNIPIRIGVNGGSLPNGLSNTPQDMIKAAKMHISILENLDFHNIILSLKSTNIFTAIKAYELASEEFDYPLHIGITESGTEFSGTIKSSIGLGILLNEGIGNTIRVSLTDDPIKEIYVAKEILGLETEEREVPFAEVKDFAECGLCGTAAVISPVGKINDHGNEICFPSGMDEMGPVTKKLYETLTGIQMGKIEGPEGWVHTIL